MAEKIKVTYFYDDLTEFWNHLQEAKNKACNQWEHDFVDNIMDQFDTYKHKTTLTQKQFDTIDKIVYG